MISDFVKGKKKFSYSPGVQKGIALHRAIDEFTDDHAATRSAKVFFKSAYRLYAGAFIDVVYDHFLANDPNEFAVNTDLAKFTSRVYLVLEDNPSQLPAAFQKMLPYMKTQNWLYNYQYRSGIEKAFGGLVNRAAYLNESNTAFLIFNNYYEELQTYYQAFFPELKEFAARRLRNLSDG
ncbi:MAG TPA: ACP phosphodiesterase [Saprospiraceae bacterium]|nr:ACP phosphodiesterase [Saprospiraceae bacterium]